MVLNVVINLIFNAKFQSPTPPNPTKRAKVPNTKNWFEVRFIFESLYRFEVDARFKHTKLVLWRVFMGKAGLSYGI